MPKCILVCSRLQHGDQHTDVGTVPLHAASLRPGRTHRESIDAVNADTDIGAAIYYHEHYGVGTFADFNPRQRAFGNRT